MIFKSTKLDVGKCGAMVKYKINNENKKYNCS